MSRGSIPLVTLFGPPDRDNPRLSPDGERVAWLAAPEGVPDIWVADLPDGSPRRVTKAPEPGISFYCWAPSGRELLYVVDQAGDENWRLHAVGVETGAVRVLTPAGVQADMLALSWSHPSQLLVALDSRAPGCFDACRLDLATGALTVLAENPGTVERWFADCHQQVRVATERQPDGGLHLLHRAVPDGDWATVLRLGPDDALASGPVAVPDEGVVLVSTADTDTARLVHLDPGASAVEVLAEWDGGDVEDLLLDPRTHRPQAVAFGGSHRSWRVLDRALAADVDAVDRLHPGEMKVVDRDRYDRRWLVRHNGPATPGTYHLWDRATGTARHLLDQQPALDEDRMAGTEPFTCVARDGLELRGYWTPPRRGRGPHAAVVLVHGGPWWRDGWEWDAEVQWLADRGYGCLRVNFRGSAGRGKEFMRAGNRQWGAAMQDDLVDGLDHAVARRWVDPRRVAVMGSSYGGYAALVAATTNPPRFRCAVSFAGPTNLVSFLETVPREPPSARRLWWARVGDPEDPADAERLRRSSPLARVQALAVPVLVGQGANDPRVLRSESDQFVEAVRAAGAPIDYLVYLDEGHGLARQVNVLHFRGAVERFLERHVPTGGLDI